MKALRPALFQVGGFLVGYGISLASSLAFFFGLHRPPQVAQPIWFMVLTAVYGIVFAMIAGYAAAAIGSYATGFAVGVAIFVASILSLVSDAGAHWSQYIALVLMSPAAVLGAKLRVMRRS
jgi:hypothetical protein